MDYQISEPGKKNLFFIEKLLWKDFVLDWDLDGKNPACNNREKSLKLGMNHNQKRNLESSDSQKSEPGPGIFFMSRHFFHWCEFFD